MNNELYIRPTTEADIQAIGDLAEATGLFPSAMVPDMIAGYLDRSKRDVWLTVATTSGLIAFAFCEPERMTVGTWNLLAISVAPPQQGQGIGTELVKYLEQLLREQGHRVLLVETLGTPEFAGTRSFYIANGFTEEARIREFYDVGSDKVIFWKHL